VNVDQHITKWTIN